MRPVRVEKVAVLAQLMDNRKKHRAIFDEAIEGYRAEVIAQLQQHIKEMKSGKPKRTYINVPFPEDHTSDYDDAIEMFQMSVDDVVELDLESFKAFYKDDWSWKRQFLTSNSNYSMTAAQSLSSLDEDE